MLDYRAEVKKILTGPNNTKIGIHLPLHLDLNENHEAYREIHTTLIKHNAGKAFVQTTTELKAGPKMNLHDYLMQADKAYASRS